MAGRPLFGAVAGPALAADLRAQLAIVAPGWTPPDTAAGVDVSKTLASLYQDDARSSSAPMPPSCRARPDERHRRAPRLGADSNERRQPALLVSVAFSGRARRQRTLGAA